MADRRIKIGMDFEVNRAGLNELQRLLRDIQNSASNSSSHIGQDTIKAVKELETILNKSWNSKLGEFNLAPLNEGIKKAYGNVGNLEKALSKTDKGSYIFDRLARSVLHTNTQLISTNKTLDKMAETMANTVRWSVTSSILNTMTGSVEQAWGFTKRLDSSLNDIRIVTGASADEMERFAEQANKAAKSLSAGTVDYTNAALIYYQQGLSEEEVQARAEITLKAANVTGQDTAEVSEQLTAVWNGYKVNAQEAELYVDKLAAVAATTAADLEELSVGMSKVASAASLMGVDIDQLNASLATVVSVTRQAPESVGTAFKTIYARMGDIEAGLDSETTLDSYTEQMQEIAGVNVLDTNNELRDMGEIIEEIGNNWTSFSREQQIALSQAMAGTRLEYWRASMVTLKVA